MTTHKGVQTEFQRLTKDDPRFTSELRAFLSHAYNLKAIADYETGPSSSITSERVAETIIMARQIAVHIAEIMKENDA